MTIAFRHTINIDLVFAGRFGAQATSNLHLYARYVSRKLGLKLAGGNVIPIDPSAKKVILCIDDDPSILRYETALFERH